MTPRDDVVEVGEVVDEADVAAPTDHGQVWCLRLYVAGQSPRSLEAVSNLHRLCEKYLPGRYEIETVDLVEHPDRAREDDILAIPTLVRRIPEPMQRVIGDLSQSDDVLRGLRIRPVGVDRQTPRWLRLADDE